MHIEARNLARIAPVLLALIGAADAHPQQPASDILRNPDIVAALWTAWSQTAFGKTPVEASFRLDGSPASYRLVATPFTNQARTQTLSVLPGITFAVFHVHAVVEAPAPSVADRSIADKYKLRMYTIHAQGLYEYDPATRKTTKLRNGIDWLIDTQNGSRRMRLPPPGGEDVPKRRPSRE